MTSNASIRGVFLWAKEKPAHGGLQWGARLTWLGLGLRLVSERARGLGRLQGR